MSNVWGYLKEHGWLKDSFKATSLEIYAHLQVAGEVRKISSPQQPLMLP